MEEVFISKNPFVGEAIKIILLNTPIRFPIHKYLNVNECFWLK